MKFSEYLKNAKLNDSVKNLMTPGLAVEFIQPWYTPLSATPSTTGIAVGGIGSTYTLTPAGTTPVMNVVPGMQVRAKEPSDLHFDHYFYRESILKKEAKLVIFDLAVFKRQNDFYTLKDTKGQALLDSTMSHKDLSEALQKLLKSKTLYSANAEALARWNIEWSPRTQTFIDEARTSGAAFNRSLLIDFFNGSVGEEIETSGSLSAAWGSEDSYLGQAGYDASKMNYTALYPVSSTQYKGKGLDISKTQWSYVTPHNERLSSLPVSATRFSISNPTKETREITIVQIQNSLTGYHVQKDRQGVQDSSFVLVPHARHPKGVTFDFNSSDGRSVKGVEFYNESPLNESDFNGCMSISVAWNPKDNLNVSAKPIFYQDTANAVLKAGLQSGRLSKTFNKNVYSGRETIAGAIAVTAVLKPKESVSFQFNTVLDFPNIHLNGLQSQKKYTTFFPEAYGRVRAILAEALVADKDFQKNLLKNYNSLVPSKFLEKIYPKDVAKQDALKSLTLNSLSFLAEATVWDIQDEFLVRECADYPFFNSLDVYFYGSFSLLALLPRLDGEVMRSFASAILATDTTERRHHEYVNHPYADLPSSKLKGPRALRGAVIHDLGSPFDANPDAYDWHNVKEWKDLAPKYVMMVLRHFNATGDYSVLHDCKEAVYASMEYLENMVDEGQNFPLTNGTDDTFDNLSSHGITVYCGSLWIAGLKAASQIATLLEDHEQAGIWTQKAKLATEEFHEALWDSKESYFHFYVTPVEMKDLVDEQLEALALAVSSQLVLDGSKIEVLKQINTWLNTAEIPEGVELSRRELRAYKKQWITAQCPQAFNASWTQKLNLDSDDVFADSMLADTYLRFLDLEPIIDSKKAQQMLQKVYQTNYKANTPLIGAANLVHQDGMPLDEFNFQAHDVWIGVQFSIASAMILHGLNKEATDIVESMLKNLYEEARIPFAAPEGFNGSSKLHADTLKSIFALSKTNAKKLHKNLITGEALLPDSRIHPKLTRSLVSFNKKYKTVLSQLKVDSAELFTLLHNTALKYTAGKYLRPGMVFALMQAASKTSKTN